MLTPFPLCSLQCVVPRTLSRWGVSVSGLTAMTVALETCWTAVHFLFSSVGIKNSVSVFLPGVLFFSIQTYSMMRSPMVTQIAYLSRPSAFYGRSSAEKEKPQHICLRPYLLDMQRSTAESWIDKLMNVGLLAPALQLMPLCLYFSNAFSLLVSLVAKALQHGMHPAVSLLRQCICVALKATESTCWVNATVGLE